MECPYCTYRYDWPVELNKNFQGDKGTFFKLSNDIEMVRDSTSWKKETIYVFGCPNCFKLFMKNYPY